MADEIDLANDMIDVEIARAVGRIRQASAALKKGPEFCVECEDTIPEARRDMGFKLCVICAEEAERHKSLYADD